VNNKLLILLFCLFFNFAWSGDTLVSFHGSKITLPQGFKELSKDQLTTLKTNLIDRQIMTVYEKQNDLNGLQRILIYYDSLTGTKNLKFEKIVALKREVIQESGLIFNHVKIDPVNHCAYGKTIVQGDTSIFGFSVDGNGMMGIQYDNSNGITLNDEKKFKHIVTSIRHDSPYEYLPEENPRVKEAREKMEHHGQLMTIAIVAMILIWGVKKYAIKNK